MTMTADERDPQHEPSSPVEVGERILAEAVERYRPVAVFALFSGGHDSLCAAHLASRTPRFDGCVHIDTGIGVPATRGFVRDTCRAFGWPLRDYRPPVPYEDIVLRYGFPGPGRHTLMYNRLKERCLRQLIRECKTRRADKVLLVTGIRRYESRRRMGYVEPIQSDGGRVWAAPLLHWTHDHKHDYLAAHRLPRNPVVERLCMSGECLCGAFARPGELDEIAFWYPEVAARIRALEDRARAAGLPCRWGHAPGGRSLRPPRAGLCWSCDARKDVESEPD